MARRNQNRRGEGDLLREEIVNATIRLLDITPVAAVTLRGIAREAGISAPAIYLQFSGLEDVLLAVMRRFWIQLGKAMASADSDAAARGPLSQLKAQVGAYLRFARSSPTSYDMLFGFEPDDKVVGQTLKDPPVALVYNTLLAAVTRCREDGYTMPLTDDIEMTTLVFVTAHGRVALSHAMPGDEFSDAEQVERFVMLVIDALCYKARP